MKPIDPTIAFWLGVATTVFLAVGNGTISLTNMIPATSVPAVTAWMSFLGLVGTTIMTGLAGLSSTQSGPIAKMLKAPKG